MNKFDRYISYYFLGAIPFIIILFTFGINSDVKTSKLYQTTNGLVWDLFGLIFIVWVLTTFYLILKTLVRNNLRQELLSKVSGIKERDERESIIAGNAAKFSFLSTMAFILFFLFLSIFTVTIAKHPEGIAMTEKKRGYISVGMHFSSFAQDAKTEKFIDENLSVFNYSGMPLSPSVLLIVILFWQLASYRIIARKYNRLVDLV